MSGINLSKVKVAIHGAAGGSLTEEQALACAVAAIDAIGTPEYPVLSAMVGAIDGLGGSSVSDWIRVPSDEDPAWEKAGGFDDMRPVDHQTNDWQTHVMEVALRAGLRV